MRKVLFLITILSWFLGASPLPAQQINFAYQLAVIHTRAVNPDKVFLKQKVKPEQSVVSEFQWLLDSLRNRCINPEQTLADTIMGTWTSLKKNGIPMSLLETTRELTKYARDTATFGTGKVDFRVTSKYWLTAKLAENIIHPPKTKSPNYGVIK